MYKKRGERKEYTGFFGRHRSLIAITTLIGTIIGAGILGIPYVVAKAGFLYGFLLIVLIGVAFVFVNLFAGEIVLRTKEQHQWTGYAEKYLGIWGKRIMAFTMFFSIYGALTAYLIGEGEALKAIFKVGTPFLYALIFFVITFIIIYRGVKATGKAELILISCLFLIVVLIGFLSVDKINLSNLITTDITKVLVPYGVILFAFLATPAIPELQEELHDEKKKMKKVIIIGSLIPIVLYIVFTFIVMGIIGVEQFDLLAPNQRIATVALSIYSYPLLGLFANILAALAMFTSFLTLGLALLEVYTYDYGLSRGLALFLTFSLPLLITVLNLTTFIVVLGLSGAVAGGLEGILVVLMYWKAKKKSDREPEYSLRPFRLLGLILILMFAFGALYQLLTNFL